MKIARLLARALIPRDRLCVAGMCLIRDNKNEAQLVVGGAHVAYSVLSPYMPQFGYPIEIFYPAARAAPCSAEGSCASSRWQYANLAALVKNVYGRAGVFAVAFSPTGQVPEVPRVRIRLPKTPPADLNVRVLRLMLAARVAAIALKAKAKEKDYIYVVNGVEAYERPEETALELVSSPTKIREVAYVDPAIAVYAGSASFLHSAAYGRVKDLYEGAD